MISRKLLAALAVATAVGLAPALGAGIYQGFPAASSNTQTGSETFPTDTNLTQGANPATELWTTQQLNLLGFVFLSMPTAGNPSAVVTVSAGVGSVLVDSTGTMTFIGVSLPSAPVDGQIFRFATTQDITTVQITGGTSGTLTVNTPPTAMLSPATAGAAPGATNGGIPRGGAAFIYRNSNTKWYRLY